MMAGIKSGNTRPERRLRSALHALGLRFRIHPKELPGKPDIVLPRHRTALFVHGCFWHRHKGCRFTTTPATRPEFWQDKFDGNIRRDAAAVTALREKAWRVAIVWECALRTDADVMQSADAVSAWLNGNEGLIEIGHARTS
jgi:DNA mismatch endonuclease (patch repair protein)